MTVSLRLDRTREQKLDLYAKTMGTSKSNLIRGMIDNFLQLQTSNPTPWDLGKDLFGRAGSGRGDLSLYRKSILKEKLRAKKSRH